MKVVGLLVILFAGALFYLVGWECYSLSDFWQELSNFTHLPLFGKQPGGTVNPAGCPKFSGFASLFGQQS